MKKVVLAAALLGATAIPAFAGITCNMIDQRGNQLVYSSDRGGHGFTNEMAVKRNGETISSGGPVWTRVADRRAKTETLWQGDWSIAYPWDVNTSQAVLRHNNNTVATGVCGPDYFRDEAIPPQNNAPVEASAPAPEPTPTQAPQAPQAADIGDAVPFVYFNDRVLITVTVGGRGTPMLLDTGANVGQIPEALADQLIASGHATEGDGFISQIANGTSSHVRSVIVDSVVVGTHVVSNVEMGVGPERLLGMNVLSHIRTGKFTIDTQNNQLVFG